MIFRIKPRLSRRKQKDSGYMLLVLMLAVAVLAITMLGVTQNYRRSIQRDQEVEMIHRGEQYERAVRRFYIKNNRYPVSLDQLENMNKVRYLRKKYKDPMSPDGEWKLVHPTDFKMTGTAAQPGANAAAAGQQATDAAGNKVDPTQSAQDTGSSTTGAQGAGTANPTGTSGAGASGGTGGSAFGNSAFGNSAFGNSGSSSFGGAGNASGTSSFVNAAGGNNAANGQVLGGGDVYGVVSKSKKKGFHIFGEKEKYNEWFFIYDPSMDKGQLLKGPYNPKMFVGSANSGLNSGKGASGSGTGTSLGNQGTTTPTSSPTPTQPNQ